MSGKGGVDRWVCGEIRKQLEANPYDSPKWSGCRFPNPVLIGDVLEVVWAGTSHEQRTTLLLSTLSGETRGSRTSQLLASGTHHSIVDLVKAVGLDIMIAFAVKDVWLVNEEDRRKALYRARIGPF